ncbi:VF_A0006 family four-cysteine protein [Photobacterium rosenbergii]|uniref:VF_A0006 family four-cysteine protein n=1 Tax=Photobacterium rosenbergii TaxID=294936 RepID=UPI001F1D2BFE|nr:VF_A0006 family four-cysteine protein [Photobacterium rosenbergii]
MTGGLTVRKVALLLIIALSSAFSVAKEDKDGYETCILEYVSLAENGTSANLMTNACHRLYIDNFMLSDKDEAYFQCLLDYLPETKHLRTAMQVKSTCNSRHRSLFN